MKTLSTRRKTHDRILKSLLYLSGGLTCALLVFLIGFIFYRGRAEPHLAAGVRGDKLSSKIPSASCPTFSTRFIICCSHGDRPAAGRGRGRVPDGIRLQPQGGGGNRIRGGDSHRHPVHYLRPGGHAVFLPDHGD
jgi:hypothetical protein